MDNQKKWGEDGSALPLLTSEAFLIKMQNTIETVKKGTNHKLIPSRVGSIIELSVIRGPPTYCSAN